MTGCAVSRSRTPTGICSSSAGLGVRHRDDRRRWRLDPVAPSSAEMTAWGWGRPLRPGNGAPSLSQRTLRMAKPLLLVLAVAAGCQGPTQTKPASSLDEFGAHLESLRAEGHI